MLEALFLEHGIYKKLEALAEIADYPVSKEAAQALEDIDQLTSNLLQCSEKKCRKLHTAHYKFIPKVKWWLYRCHVFRQLLRIQSGQKVKNYGNIKRSARRYGIDNPMQHSVKDLVELYKQCKVSMKRLMDESLWMREEFLPS